MNSKCKFKDCKRDPRRPFAGAKGYCSHHYIMIRSVTLAGEDDKSCEFDSCKLTHYAKGLCHLHYNLARSIKLVAEGAA